MEWFYYNYRGQPKVKNKVTVSLHARNNHAFNTINTFEVCRICPKCGNYDILVIRVGRWGRVCRGLKSTSI